MCTVYKIPSRYSHPLGGGMRQVNYQKTSGSIRFSDAQSIFFIKNVIYPSNLIEQNKKKFSFHAFYEVIVILLPMDIME